MKIFGVGLNKTGTTTLGAAAALFGLRTKSWDAALFRSTIINKERAVLWETIDQFDVFDDFPYSLLYREIDARYPGSKFVLTERESVEKWLKSIKAHAMRASPLSVTHKTVYGSRFPHGNEDAYIDYYNNHNTEARGYFDGRPDDFLTICWEKEKDLDRLAEFFGVEAPTTPVPHANARAAKLANPTRLAYNFAARLWQNL